jgi:transposase
VSERTACKLLGVERSSYRYEPRTDRNAELREEMVKLARQKPRFGYRRLHALLERRGHEENVKWVYRLYREEGLSVRRKKRKRLVREPAAEPMFCAAKCSGRSQFSCSRPTWAPHSRMGQIINQAAGY